MNYQAYIIELNYIIEQIPSEKRNMFFHSFVSQSKNPTVAFGFSVFLGYFGIDRMYIGQVGLGILKLITMGGFGLWVLIDVFIIAGETRTQNIEKARSLRLACC